MIRLCFVAALLATALSTPADAQSNGGPAIAYVKVGGSSQEIYLVNPDGTGLTKIYTGPRKANIGYVDINPGGNEVVFAEQFKIKIQRYFDNGQPNGQPTAVPSPCNAWAPDYHPSGDGSFVFVSGCAFGNMQIMKYTPGTPATVAPIATTNATNRLRWSRTGEYLYYDDSVSSTDPNVRLRRRTIATDAVDDFGVLTNLDSFDVTHRGEELVFGSPFDPKLFDFASMTDTSQATDLCLDGTGIHFSPDALSFIYETPHSARGDYILTGASNCSGGAIRLTGKGEWGPSDWRPNPIP